MNTIIMTSYAPSNTLLQVEDLGLFMIEDVMGDGNCFFNALVLSKHIDVSCPRKLRASVCDAIEDQNKRTLMKYIYTEIAKESEVMFTEWTRKLRCNGYWGGATAALFVCYVFEINICIVTNGMQGFIKNDLRTWENNYFKEEKATNVDKFYVKNGRG